jgi:hypothetical protein
VDGVTAFVNSKCQNLQPLLENPAFKAIASNGRPEDLIEVALLMNGGWNTVADLCLQLLSLLLMVAVTGPEDVVTRFIPVLQHLNDAVVQEQLKHIIELVRFFPVHKKDTANRMTENK